MLITFFSVVYFFVLFRIIDLIFRNTLNIITDILAVACLIAALIVSVGLADYTVKKIKDYYGKNNLE
jgi:hypothetical protein